MRLIDADALKERFDDYIKANPNISGVFELGKFIIDNAPTVELFCSYLSDGEVRQPCVESPCKHERPQGDTPAGKWIPSEETYTDLSGTIETYTRFKCDRCLRGQNFGPYPFCPWCGAKMQEETKT